MTFVNIGRTVDFFCIVASTSTSAMWKLQISTGKAVSTPRIISGFTGAYFLLKWPCGHTYGAYNPGFGQTGQAPVEEIPRCAIYSTSAKNDDMLLYMRNEARPCINGDATSHGNEPTRLGWLSHDWVKPIPERWRSSSHVGLKRLGKHNSKKIETK